VSISQSSYGVVLVFRHHPTNLEISSLPKSGAEFELLSRSLHLSRPGKVL
jgi:hypothetical protein